MFKNQKPFSKAEPQQKPQPAPGGHHGPGRARQPRWAGPGAAELVTGQLCEHPPAREQRRSPFQPPCRHVLPPEIASGEGEFPKAMLIATRGSNGDTAAGGGGSELQSGRRFPTCPTAGSRLTVLTLRMEIQKGARVCVLRVPAAGISPRSPSRGWDTASTMSPRER